MSPRIAKLNPRLEKGNWPAHNASYLTHNIRQVFHHRDIKYLTKGTYRFIINHMGFIAHYSIHGFKDVYGGDLEEFAKRLQTGELSNDYDYNLKLADRQETDPWFIKRYGKDYQRSIAESIRGIVGIARKYYPGRGTMRMLNPKKYPKKEIIIPATVQIKGKKGTVAGQITISPGFPAKGFGDYKQGDLVYIDRTPMKGMIVGATLNKKGELTKYQIQMPGWPRPITRKLEEISKKPEYKSVLLTEKTKKQMWPGHWGLNPLDMHRFRIVCSRCGIIASATTLDKALDYGRWVSRLHKKPGEQITIHDAARLPNSCYIYDTYGSCLAWHSKPANGKILSTHSGKFAYLFSNPRGRKGYLLEMNRFGHITLSRTDRPGSIYFQVDYDIEEVMKSLTKSQREDLENGWEVYIPYSRPSIWGEYFSEGNPKKPVKKEETPPIGKWIKIDEEGDPKTSYYIGWYRIHPTVHVRSDGPYTKTTLVQIGGSPGRFEVLRQSTFHAPMAKRGVKGILVTRRLEIVPDYKTALQIANNMKREAVSQYDKLTKDFFLGKNPENPGLYDFMLENRKKYIRYNTLFYRTFGVQLKNYWNNITGFDIIKFDEEFVKPPEGVSTAQAVGAKYGEAAVRLIGVLLL